MSGVSITIQTSVPAGTSLPYRGGTVPFGYLLEDGSLVSRVTYARLFEAIGTTHGAGDGSTTFKLPDSRGRTDIGAGIGSGLSARTLGQTGGAETHQLSESEMPSHTHIQNAHSHSLVQVADVVGTGGGIGVKITGATELSTNGTTATNQNTGGNAAHNNMQPFLVATKMIKY